MDSHLKNPISCHEHLQLVFAEGEGWTMYEYDETEDGKPDLTSPIHEWKGITIAECLNKFRLSMVSYYEGIF